MEKLEKITFYKDFLEKFATVKYYNLGGQHSLKIDNSILLFSSNLSAVIEMTETTLYLYQLASD